MTSEKDIITAAVRHYGLHSQVDMAIEEMSELTKALLKHRRGPADEAARDAIREEMADVEIMLAQMKIFFGDTQAWKEMKLKRLASRLGLQKGGDGET